MSTIVVDAAFKEKLLAAGPLAELRDEGGNLLGQFSPLAEVWDEAGNLVGRFVSPDGPAKYIVEGTWPSDEELERLATQAGPRYTPEQVMERLRSIRDAS